jgi:hypothetical protein
LFQNLNTGAGESLIIRSSSVWAVPVKCVGSFMI